MLRTSTLTVLGLLTLGSLGLHGCGAADASSPTSRPADPEVGEVGLDLRLPDASSVEDVSFTIAHAGLTPRTGTIPVSADGHARMQVGNLPAGAGYRITLTAARSGLPPCEGSADFSISARETSRVSLALQCGALDRTGNVAVDGSFNYCPSRPTLIATPSSVAVGAPVSVSAESLDEDPITFAWSAASGSFLAPARASTTFTCSVPGTVTLEVSVADDQGCNDVRGSVEVTCIDAVRFSSQPAYLVPLAAGVTTKAILSVGDSAGTKPDQSPYRLVGLPDGLGAFDNENGTFTLLVNHELGASVGAARAHGGLGAFVSRWTIRKSDLGVLDGADLIQSVQLWSTASAAHAPTPDVAFARLCSGDLPRAALYEAGSGLGFDGSIYFNAEKASEEGRAFAHVLDGNSYELPWLGKASWENIVVSPHVQAKTIAVGLDDSTTGQVYVYVGTKTNSGLSIARAGLTNGQLHGVKVTGLTDELPTGVPTGQFTLASLGDVSGMSGAALEAASNAADVTRFLRPQDGAWDPAHPGDFYFLTSNAIAAPSRLFRLRFADIARPELGGSIEMLLDGSEGQVRLDNLSMDARGHIMLTEDPGNNARIAQVWRYDLASDQLVNVAQHNPSLFSSGAAGYVTQDEAASGVLDMTAILGPGWWLISDQLHTSAGAAELVERGQLIALFDPGSI